MKTQLDCDWDLLSLLGTNDIPRDCQLLIVAGPRAIEFLPGEVEKIAAYLKNGGRLLALLRNFPAAWNRCSQAWGVAHRATAAWWTRTRAGVMAPVLFLPPNIMPHPVINPLAKDQMPILMAAARPIYSDGGGKIPGAPEVKFLASTSTNARG